MSFRTVLLSTFALALVGGCTSSKCASCKMGQHEGHEMGHHEDNEADEVKVKFADVPAPVKATLAREAGGVMIDSVDVETHGMKKIYEADAMMGGKNYEIKVAEDGILVSKKLDEGEGDEKDEKKGKDEEKEDGDKK